MSSRSHFSSLAEGVIKLNFDRASKGNLGEGGLGGLFRDSQAHTCFIYAKSCGISSNNEVEFTVVREGLLIAIKLGYRNLEVEGDSRLVINTVKNSIMVQSGTNLVKAR